MKWCEISGFLKKMLVWPENSHHFTLFLLGLFLQFWGGAKNQIHTPLERGILRSLPSGARAAELGTIAPNCTDIAIACVCVASVRCEPARPEASTRSRDGERVRGQGLCKQLQSKNRGHFFFCNEFSVFSIFSAIPLYKQCGH